MRTFAAMACGLVLGLTSTVHAADIVLKKVMFPTTLGGTTGPTAAPTAAPLSQPVVFVFSGTPIFPSSISTSIRISVDPSNSKGQPVGLAAFGDFEASGNTIIFRPRLPSGPVPDGFAPGTDIANDPTLPGLLPDTTYRIELPLKTPNSITNLKSSNVVLPLAFTTKPAIAGPLLIPSLYSNAPAKAPKIDKAKLKPKSGTNGISPNLFTDPAGLFSSIPASKKPPFKLRFTSPVDPQADNISPSKIRLRVTKDANDQPLDSIVLAEVVMTSNTSEGASISLYPLSILPLGSTVTIEISDLFRALFGTTKNDGSTPEAFLKVAEYRVANSPNGTQPIDDVVVENFDDSAHLDASIAVSEGLQVAGWDNDNSNVLKASFGFGGDGSLGRFEAADVDITINLDTDFQALPLFSGATPDAAPGTTVKGGVFNFTSFHLPPNVTLRARGSNPLVITCTGDCLIEGVIDLDGAPGTVDDTFDSAISPAPGGQGGAGGGKGGDGHPVVLPAGGDFNFMQTPQFGQSGFAPKTKANPSPTSGGGGGGQCGCTMPWTGFTSNQCTNYDATGDGSRGSGGGGGSFNVFFPNVGATQTSGQGPETPGVLVSGRRGAVGMGNHLPVVFDGTKPIPNEPAAYLAQPGNPTNAVAKPSTNPTFQEAYNQSPSLVYDNGPTLMNVNASNWAKTTKVTLPGAAGPMVFTDSDNTNNFIGPGGELSEIRGGQGGGGAGSRTEGLSQICKAVIFTNLGLPFTVLDAKGGGGGGAGGAIEIQALGTITLQGAKAKISAKGGIGGSSEEIGSSSRGGAAGGGSGGCIVLQSATAVDLSDPALVGFALDVSPGPGREAAILTGAVNAGVAGGEQKTLQVGDGGPGAPGLVQIHVPPAAQGLVNKAHIGADISYSMFNILSGTGVNDGLDPFDPLVPMAKTPTPITPQSVARSTWYDLGLITSAFRPKISTSAGLIDGPIFGVPGEGPFFKGTDKDTGLVQTDAAGNVSSPFTNDLEVDAPDILKADFIPQGPTAFQSVKVEFQGADEDPQNPGLPNTATATGWVTDATLVNGRRFIRFQVLFDIATNPLVPVTPSTPRPQVNFLKIPFKY